MQSLRDAFGVAAPPLVVAEIGGNHDGRLDRALEMVDAAKAAGADAVKFQTYVTDRFVSRSHRSYQEFAREALSFDDFQNVARHCGDNGIAFFSTPFDEDSADFLESLDVPAFKIASGDLTHLPLIEHVARKGRPILLSTGAATWAEVDVAVKTVQDVAAAELVLLYCVAAYPAPDAEIGLHAIAALQRRYGLEVGFSDHTLGIDIALAAVAQGATVVEKHFTTNPDLPGGDNAMSITPDEMRRLVTGSKRIAAVLGDVEPRVTASERQILPAIRRSLVLRRALAAGDVLTPGDVLVVRPSGELAPADLESLTGRRVARDLPALHTLERRDVHGTRS